MIFFRYRHYLEQQIEELKTEKAELMARNDKLVEALVPVLRKMNETMATTPKVEETARVAHRMNTVADSATCSCGWHANCGDPALLQQAISDHYRENIRSLRAGRKSWPQVKQMLEGEQNEA